MKHFKNFALIAFCAFFAAFTFSLTAGAAGYGDNEVIDDFDVPYGDVNGDDFIDVRDLVRLKKYLSDVSEGVEINLAASNVSATDNVINAQDLTALRKLLLTI